MELLPLIKLPIKKMKTNQTPQNHSGTGDNIGRDKVTNVKFPFKSLLLLTAIVLVIIAGYKYQNKIEPINSITLTATSNLVPFVVS